MAKIHEEILVIKISTLLPDHSSGSTVMDSEKIAALEQIIMEFAGTGKTLVEIEAAQ